jgi:hypothetical protein
MPAKVIRVFPETALERILDALEHELIEASDADILEAAHDLGMKPEMKGSAAFLGLRYPGVHRPEDYFDRQWMLRVLNDPRHIWLASSALPANPELPGPAPAPGSRKRPAPLRSRRSARKYRDGD